MSTMSRLCAASLLTLTLSVVTLAGDIHTTVVNPPPPSNPATSSEGDTTGVYGDIHTPKDEGFTVTDPVVEAALSLARAVLALF
jgi:hypothetical protein